MENRTVPEKCRDVYSLVWLANSFLGVLCGSGQFLTMLQKQHVNIVGDGFLRLYISLCHVQPQTWYMRPKFHLLWHMIHDPMLRPSGRNTSWDCTWMDEDFVKKTMRILKGCHRRTAQAVVLQKYLVLMQGKLKALVPGR